MPELHLWGGGGGWPCSGAVFSSWEVGAAAAAPPRLLEKVYPSPGAKGKVRERSEPDREKAGCSFPLEGLKASPQAARLLTCLEERPASGAGV